MSIKINKIRVYIFVTNSTNTACASAKYSIKCDDWFHFYLSNLGIKEEPSREK